VFRALKLGAPLSVQGASTRVNKETYPLGSMVTYRFAERSDAAQANNVHVRGLSGIQAGQVALPACKVVWYDGGLRPPRPELLPDGVQMGDNGRLLVGDKGVILGNAVYPQGLQSGLTLPELPASIGHYNEWVEACKGGRPAGANFDWAGPLAEAVLLGNVALRVGLREDLTLSPLKWDPAALRVTNLDEANQYIRRTYREGWSLGAA
jgi:hypothetical protein